MGAWRWLAAHRGGRVLAGAAVGIGVAIASPLFWVVAAPLEVRSVPEPADAIVVLGGGVKDDGSPSAATLERTRQGIALFQQGLASWMILSTGMVAGFNEAEVMQRVALEAGIPEERIILEQASRNTRENLPAVRRLMQERGWTRALVVSSPYHMRRVAMTHRKCCADISAVFVPAASSWFYERRGWLGRLAQAQAVAHEYGGIGWYWLRGYL